MSPETIIPKTQLASLMSNIEESCLAAVVSVASEVRWYCEAVQELRTVVFIFSSGIFDPASAGGTSWFVGLGRFYVDHISPPSFGYLFGIRLSLVPFVLRQRC